MKRDLKIWELLLRQERDGTPPHELKNYEEADIVYNAALLVEGGFVEGYAIRGGNGEYSGVQILNLKNEGHDLLETLERESANLETEMPMTSKSQQQLSVFISHSSKDEKLANALVMLLRNALNIPTEHIRCTSVNGYRLPIGADTEERLRQEVHAAKAFIGLITPSSIASAYVMFELGARWGAKLYLAPLLGAGAGTEYLRGPLSSLNALNCEDAGQVQQLISDLANLLEVHDPSPPAAYQQFIDDLIKTSKTERPTKENTPATSSPPNTTELESQEIAVLKLFSQVDGSLRKNHIIEHLTAVLGGTVHHLKADQLLERLVKRNLLHRAIIVGGPPYYLLTSGGRDYLIENNLL